MTVDKGQTHQLSEGILKDSKGGLVIMWQDVANTGAQFV